MSLTATERNYELCQEAISLKDNIEGQFVALGEHLKAIRDDKKYLPSWETFADYLQEMKMSEATASKLISIYEKFILQFGYTPLQIVHAGGWSTVSEILPMIKTAEDAKQWLFDAEHLTRSDLRIKITEARTGKPQEACKHADSYALNVCRTCGFKSKIHEQE